MSAQAETCLGNDCPQYRECYVTTMRQRAAESDLVIVNHHLLCADASVRQSTYGEVIPDCHHAIIDEAHHLEDVATQYFGIAVSNYRISDLVRDSERALNLGMIEDFDSDLRHAVTRVDDHSLTFFGALQTARHARGGFEERLRIGPGWFGDVLDDGLGLIAALGGLDEAMRKKAGSDESGAQVNEDAATLARRAAELRDHLTFLLEAANPSFVYFLETRNRGVFLRAAPIDVSQIINEMLFNRMRATVMTSATLTVAGSFDYVKGRLGVSEADCVRVQSEFDFAEQAILYLPKQMPPPKSPQYGDAVAREVRDLLTQDRGPRVRAVYELRDAAHGPRPRRAGSAIPGDRPGHGAAQRAARAVPLDAERGAVCDLVLLAGRRCRRRTAELRDHRQAAVRLAGRSDYGGANRGHQRRGRRCLPGLPGAAGDSRDAAGTWTPHPPSHRSRRPGGPRSPAAHDGIRPPLPRLVSAGAGDPEPRGDHAVFRKLTYTDIEGNTPMRQMLTARVTAVLIALSIAAPALAQSTMVRGKVIDAKQQPIANVTITVESLDGSGRKLTTKTDKKGEFVQLLTASGMYRVTASEPKIGTASNDTKVALGKVSEMTIVLAPSTAANDAAKAAELKKLFEEGVTASRAGQHDAAIEKFTAALAISPACFDCQFNIGVALMAKKDEKGAEEAWKKALEMKPDYAEPLNALSTLYNNQKRFDEAAAMSAKAAVPAAVRAAPTRRSTRASSSGTRARSPKRR